MKHEHEVKLPPSFQEQLDRARHNLDVNKKKYAYGLGGFAIGVIGTRLFSRPAVTQVVVIETVVAD